MRRLRAWFAATHPGGSGAPPAWPLRAGREELADLRRECLMRNAAWSRGVVSWEATAIATVERREARARIWVCDVRAAPRKRGIVRMRLPALRPLGLGDG